MFSFMTSKIMIPSFIKIIGLLCLCSLVTNCRKDEGNIGETSIIKLRYIKSHEDDSIDNAVQGFKWALSYIGAKHFNDEGIKVSGDLIVFNYHYQGFSTSAIQKMNVLKSKIVSTEDYKKFESIDLGRFITLLMGASEHYYAFVDQPKKMSDLIKKYVFAEKKGFINESSVSPKNRILSFSNQLKFNQLFITEEVDKNTGEILEYETFDLMDNGQLRFGIYNVDGDLINSASPMVSNAGKPAKCIWCHESKIQPIFSNQNDYDNYLTYIELQDTINYFKDMLESNQKQLSTGVEFSAMNQHAETELVYISFMEPSLQRLVTEWQLTENEALSIVEGLPTHVHPEFPFLGDLYERESIDKLAPYKNLAVPSSIRETSLNEVNYLN